MINSEKNIITHSRNPKYIETQRKEVVVILCQDFGHPKRENSSLFTY